MDRRGHLALLLLILLPLFAYGGRWGTQGNMDAIAVDVAAWELAASGSLDLSDLEAITANQENLSRWFVETEDGRLVSNRAPGLIALATPSYMLLPGEDFSAAPGTAVALITTLAAVLITWHLLIPLVGLNAATLSALVLALGTTTWQVSSSELWPHGPGQLWASLAILALSSASFAGAGWAFAASITTRPITGMFAAVTGLRESYRLRSWKPAVQIAAITSLGVGALVAYNRFVFGSWSLRGGYSESFTSGAVERFDLWAYLQNVYEMFLGLPNGVLVTTPILLVAVVGAVKARKSIPGWAISSALAGLAYLLIHAALNRASGGAALFYRYPLEAIVMASPALAVGAASVWRSSTLGGRIVTFAAIISVALQFLNVFVLVCTTADPVVHTCLLQ